MLLINRKRFAFLSCVITIFVFCQIAKAGDEWRAIAPSELAMKTSKVEPDADAEAIFWEVRIDDGSEDLTESHYLRVKIFTENGREKYSKIDIPYAKGIKIKNIEARVIRPDGSFVVLEKTDIFDREIVKTNDVKVKAKSFAVPNIEPGVIVEYRYKKIVSHGWAQNMRLEFQHDIPIQDITYYFKPALNARTFLFNMDDKLIKDKNGFYRATMKDVPALKDEPRMPPTDEVRAWTLIFYTRDLKADTSKFWSYAGYDLAQFYDIKKTLKPGKTLKAAAAEMVTGISSDDEKMAKIFEFCKTKVKNLSFDTSLTDDQKDELKPNKNADDTYARLQGSSDDINELFASLADSLGFEARIAFGGDKRERFFNVNRAHLSFVHFSSAAVKANGQWKFYDPGDLFTPFGMLPWYEENTDVLLLGYKDYVTTETPYSGVEKSVAKRIGRFKLLEDGTLEGTVRIEYTGQSSYVRKMNNYDKAPEKREEMLKDSIKERMSTAELSAISIENADDPEKPFTYQYNIRVPNYAQRTGKRLFLQPGFFEYGTNPAFSSASRKYDIFFNYGWSEADDIQIELPIGFSLDNAEAPAEIADSGKISSQKINIGINKADNVLTYKRDFYFGDGGNTFFRVSAYQPLKNLFDEFHKAVSHTITLKQN